MPPSEIDNCYKNYVEAYNDQCADGYIGYHGRLEIVEHFAAIQHTKYKAYIGRVEKDNMQNMLI